MSYATCAPPFEMTVIRVGAGSAPSGIVIVKSDPGNDSEPPSGPTTDDTRSSTVRCEAPHRTAFALACSPRYVKATPTALGGRESPEAPRSAGVVDPGKSHETLPSAPTSKAMRRRAREPFILHLEGTLMRFLRHAP